MASTNTYYDDYITNRAGGTWDVLVGGWEGTSTGNFTTATDIRAGTESTTQSSSVKSCASERNLSWIDANGNNHNGWIDAEGGVYVYENDPPWISFVDVDGWQRTYINTSC